MCYDIVDISLEITSAGNTLQFVSNSILCFSNYRMDAENIEHIVMSILDENDADINNSVFMHSAAEKTLYGEDISNSSVYSIGAFLEYVKDVIILYRQYYSKFRVNAKHKLTQRNKITDIGKVSSISQNSISWITKNLDKLYEVSSSDICIDHRYYVPMEIESVQYEKEFRIYENEIIVGLILQLLKKVTTITAEYEVYIDSEKDLLNSLTIMGDEFNTSPLISIKKKYLEKKEEDKRVLNELYKELQFVYKKYSDLLNCKGILFEGIPVKTNIFSQLQHYKAIYNLIVKYELYSSIDYNKEKIISSIKTIDKMYEYYCLFRLLKLFKSKGFTLNSSLHYQYDDCFLRHNQDCNVANTYLLGNEQYNLKVFYEPMIYNFENDLTNGIKVFRTTDDNYNYYCPDFLLSFEDMESEITHYVILDSKYSTRYILKKHDTLFSAVKKYHLELNTIDTSSNIDMICLLQGKVDNDIEFERYHNSPMSRNVKPKPSSQIFSLNKDSDINNLYDEIIKYIS